MSGTREPRMALGFVKNLKPAPVKPGTGNPVPVPPEFSDGTKQSYLLEYLRCPTWQKLLPPPNDFHTSHATATGMITNEIVYKSTFEAATIKDEIAL
ncbi:hypothetical protein CJ030_MR1G028211 [Morella rubra]|uniref:Uncharacterized protein n=1 Tax=Morella rubra TaxID=262757 RepID=A0A6A1WWP7_9ROSI|nr:hypothetical protein CJ030_MR1G028202 [Morella rubra]KAB1227090.1 hypothetical protein CJ030_MR1G028211 [Morella rubra]